jgi:sec-independent protein translocase protein TatA
MLLFIGGPEILIILFFVLLLFGSKKIPEVARMLGKGMREFRRATDEIKKEINDETKDVSDDFKDLKKNLRG